MREGTSASDDHAPKEPSLPPVKPESANDSDCIICEWDDGVSWSVPDKVWSDVSTKRKRYHRLYCPKHKRIVIILIVCFNKIILKCKTNNLVEMGFQVRKKFVINK